MQHMTWHACSVGMTAGCAQNLVLLRSKVSGGTQAASVGPEPFSSATTGSMEGPSAAPTFQIHIQLSDCSLAGLKETDVYI